MLVLILRLHSGFWVSSMLMVRNAQPLKWWTVNIMWTKHIKPQNPLMKYYAQQFSMKNWKQWEQWPILTTSELISQLAKDEAGHPPEYLTGSNPRPAGRTQPRMSTNVAQPKIVNLLKTWVFFVITCCTVFNVWPKRTLLLPVWPRDTKMLDSSEHATF